MASVEVLRARREKLTEAITTGQLKVRFADREVTYRSMAEMREALGVLEGEIARAEGRRRTRLIRVNNRKGWGS